jgi:glycosyltransferase involved in cell wall biosynthesis
LLKQEGRNKIKIAQVSSVYYPHIGGIETHVKAISERLAKDNYEVDVLTTDCEGHLNREEIINGVRVKRFKAWAPSESYFFSGSLKKYLQENFGSYDIVHAHNYHVFPSLYASQAKSGCGKFVFSSHYHGTGHTPLRAFLHKPYKPFGKKIFAKADRVVCVSDYERALVIKNFNVPQEKLVVIPNGVDWSEFRNLERNRNDTDNKIVLYVGRIEKYKGLDTLVKVLPRLDKNVVLEIVGKGPYKKEVIDLSAKVGVSQRVRFYEGLSKEDLLQKYINADIVALLSRFESYGLTIAEALAAGTRCLVANTQALSNWVDNDACFGINYPVDLAELSRLVTSLLNKTGKPVSHRKKVLDWGEVTQRLEREVYETF